MEKDTKILASLERQEDLLERILKMYENHHKSLIELVDIAKAAVASNKDSFNTIEKLAVTVEEQGRRIDKLTEDLVIVRNDAVVSRNLKRGQED